MSDMSTDAVYEPPGFEMIGESEPIEADPQGCSMGRFWESQHISSDVQMLGVQGRLKSHARFWKEVLQAPPTVMDWICNGYKLPLLYMPTPFSQKNHGSALENKEFVSGAIMELMRNRCVKKLDSKPSICSPLSVVNNSDGKLRLVLNLRHLNQFLRKDKFKYEDLRVATLMVEKEDFLFKFDLKSSYHHVDIFEDHQKYLGFAWELQGCTQYFAFKVLPFGLATACYAFTKLMRPMAKHWRGRGLRAVVYIDDGIVAVKGKEEAKTESVWVQRDLSDACLVPNDTKSQWSPEKIIAWLGFELDVEQGQLRVPRHKMLMLQERLRMVSTSLRVPAKLLASIIGQIISMSVALGPVTRLMTRGLYAALNNKVSWCQWLSISSDARSELRFWVSCMDQFNGQDMWPKPSAVRVVYSDASGTGYGVTQSSMAVK